MNIKHLMTPPHSELHDLYIERYVRTRKAHIVGKGHRQVYMKHKDGSSFLIALKVEEFTPTEAPAPGPSSTLGPPTGELLFQGIVHRITQRTWVEEDGLNF